MIVIEGQCDARPLAQPRRFEHLRQRHDVADAEQRVQVAEKQMLLERRDDRIRRRTVRQDSMVQQND